MSSARPQALPPPPGGQRAAALAGVRVARRGRIHAAAAGLERARRAGDSGAGLLVSRRDAGLLPQGRRREDQRCVPHGAASRSGTAGGRDPGARALRSAGVGGGRERTAGIPAGFLVDAETAYAGEARHGGADFPGRLLDCAMGGASGGVAADGVRYRGARMARLRRVCAGAADGATGWRSRCCWWRDCCCRSSCSVGCPR